MKVVYHPAVQRDVSRILRHYDGINDRLGDEFWEELNSFINKAAANPRRFHFEVPDRRRVNLTVTEQNGKRAVLLPCEGTLPDFEREPETDRLLRQRAEEAGRKPIAADWTLCAAGSIVKQLHVLTGLHGARDLPKALEQRLD